MNLPVFGKFFKVVVVDREDYISPMKHTEVTNCDKCGALVLSHMTGEHTDWHMQNDIEVDTGEIK